MKYDSDIPRVPVSGRTLHFARVWVPLLALSVIAGACLTIGRMAERKDDRGFKFDHALHFEQGLEDCSTCHDMTVASETPPLSMPAHELCGVCHEIPEDPAEDPAKCTFCHTSPENAVAPWQRLLSEEVKFSHEPHLTAEVACAECHSDPDKGRLPDGPAMAFCMDCHARKDPKLNECSVCHSEISKDVRPTMRDGKRLPHDVPQVWENIHGRESLVNPAYCAMCHEAPQDCDACHSVTPPKDHTLAWRRKTHGIRAQWDRNSCATCHEEDACVRCHSETTPVSHKAAWGSPVNRHCVSCHFPASKNECTVCHESIDHPRALPSPHNLGIFPANCALCHPGGQPFRAPHALNSTVHCVVCHQ